MKPLFFRVYCKKIALPFKISQVPIYYVDDTKIEKLKDAMTNLSPEIDKVKIKL